MDEISKMYYHQVSDEKFSERTNVMNDFKQKLTERVNNGSLKFIGISSPVVKKLVKEFSLSQEEANSALMSILNSKPFFVLRKKSYDDEEEVLEVDFGDSISIKLKLDFTEEELFYVNRHYEISKYIRIYEDKIGIMFMSPIDSTEF